MLWTRIWALTIRKSKTKFQTKFLIKLKKTDFKYNIRRVQLRKAIELRVKKSNRRFLK